MRTHIESPNDLGMAIRRIRESHGWSQRRLAGALGVSQRYLHELEVGRPKRVDEHYFAVLAALGIRIIAETQEVPRLPETAAVPGPTHQASPS